MPRKAKRDRPSFANDRQYEALRDQGMSKQKAARIANSHPAEMAGNRRNPGRSYEEWTKDELYAKAREVDVAGRSSMSKGELISALRNG